MIDHDEMVDVLAQADPARVWAAGDAEAPGQEHHGEHLVHPAEPAGIDLAEADGIGLQQLLEDHAVLALFARGDADGRDAACDRRMAEHVIGRGGFLDPPGVEPREVAHPLDRDRHVPALVRIDHELAVGADLLAHDRAAADVVGQVRADLQLEVVPACGHAFAAEAADLVVVVAEPAGARGVGRVAVALEFGDAPGLAALAFTEDRQCLVGRQGIGQVAEVDARHELLGGEFAQQAPERQAALLRPQVPHRVDDRGRRQVQHALLGADPSQLRLVRQRSPEAREVRRDRRQRAPNHEGLEGAYRSHADLRAAADREGEAVALEPGRIGVQDDVGGGVIGIGVDGVGSVEVIARGEADVEDLE